MFYLMLYTTHDRLDCSLVKEQLAIINSNSY